MNYFIRTAVLPEELPLPFSNEQLYKNNQISEKKMRRNNLLMSVDDIVKKNSRTIPLKAKMCSSTTKFRIISLIHPLSQIRIAKFFITNETEILRITKQSLYSVRSPQKRNSEWYDWNKSEKEKFRRLKESFTGLNSDFRGSENLIHQYRSYFSFSKAADFGSMFETPEFKHAVASFAYFSKLDIDNFFPSIYTHSFAWSVFGDKARAKINIGKGGIGNYLDSEMQNLNFGETNGIVVGPDFSRFAAEILLGRVDINVEKNLRKNGLKESRDYQVFRFVDDIFVFYNNVNVESQFVSEYVNEIEQFNLRLNTQKASRISDTIAINDSVVNPVRVAWSDFLDSRKVLQDNYNGDSGSESKDNNSITRGTSKSWQLLFDRVAQAALDNPKDATKIINYFIASVSDSLNNPIGGTSKSYLRYLRTILSGFSTLLKISPVTSSYRYFYSDLRQIINSLEKSESTKKETAHEGFALVQGFIIRMMNYPWFDFEQGYDILLFSKHIRKLSGLQPDSQFLIEKIEGASNKYFIWTAIANFMLNDKNNNVNSGYKTTLAFLEKQLEEFVDNPPRRGLKKDWLLGDSEWFYILNDFLKYPALNSDLRDKIEEKMKEEYKNSVGDDNTIRDLIGSESYYRWGISLEDATSKLLFKKLVSKMNVSTVNVSF